jgi:hypothetical protein
VSLWGVVVIGPLCGVVGVGSLWPTRERDLRGPQRTNATQNAQIDQTQRTNVFWSFSVSLCLPVCVVSLVLSRCVVSLFVRRVFSVVSVSVCNLSLSLARARSLSPFMRCCCCWLCGHTHKNHTQRDGDWSMLPAPTTAPPPQIVDAHTIVLEA